MKTGFIIFLTTVLSVYTLVNLYIYTAAKRALFLKGNFARIFIFAFLMIVFAFPFGRILNAYKISAFDKFFIHLGSWWLGAMFYIFIFIMAIDVLRLIFIKAGVLPGILTKNRELTGRILALSIIIIIFSLLIYGFFNARKIRITEVKISSENPLSKLNLRAAMISDVHLGTMIQTERLEKIKNAINKLNPDIVFIVGDLLDENPQSFGIFEDKLKTIKSRLGVYSVLGNHEFYAGLENSEKFFKNSNVRLLRNELITLEQKFNLIGVDDRTARRLGLKTLDLSEIVKKADNGLPTILLSHQPVEIDKAASLGIDLMLCGHVHGGQLFPVRFITNWIFGLKKRNFKVADMKVFISDGVGTWGPPFRVGSVSEIVKIELKE